jgi:general secretion pathway protein K
MRITPTYQRRRASILILALWSICLLSIFAVYLGAAARQKLSLARRLDERDKLYYIAQAGVEAALTQITYEDEKPTALKDGWSSNPGVFKDVEIDDGTFNVCYNYRTVSSDEPQTRYGIVDEQRKINLNTADIGLLERFFAAALNYSESQAQDLAASIIDWRDSDSMSSVPLGSAEDTYYRFLQYPYEAKDAAFEVLEEALLVKGMEKDVFERLKGYITIYGNGRININTASRYVLRAAGLNEKLADMVIAFRNGKDETEATADDSVFDAPANIVPLLSQQYSLSPEEITVLGSAVERYLTTQSSVFTIRSVGRLKARSYTLAVSCTVTRDKKLLAWQES